MKDFLRTHQHAARCAAAVTFLLAMAASPSVAAELAAEQLSDARDMANPERMTEPGRPANAPAARPADRNLTRPEATAPATPPDNVREDEGERAIVGDTPAAPTAQAPAEAIEP